MGLDQGKKGTAHLTTFSFSAICITLSVGSLLLGSKNTNQHKYRGEAVCPPWPSERILVCVNSNDRSTLAVTCKRTFSAPMPSLWNSLPQEAWSALASIANLALAENLFISVGLPPYFRCCLAASSVSVCYFYTASLSFVLLILIVFELCCWLPRPPL